MDIKRRRRVWVLCCNSELKTTITWETEATKDWHGYISEPLLYVFEHNFFLSETSFHMLELSTSVVQLDPFQSTLVFQIVLESLS